MNLRRGSLLPSPRSGVSAPPGAIPAEPAGPLSRLEGQFTHGRAEEKTPEPGRAFHAARKGPSEGRMSPQEKPMRRMRDVYFEDAVTARMKLRHPEIRRIGVKPYANVWRCYRVWMVRGAPTLSYDETDKLLDEADAILMRIAGEHDDPKGKPLN